MHCFPLYNRPNYIASPCRPIHAYLCFYVYLIVSLLVAPPFLLIMSIPVSLCFSLRVFVFVFLSVSLCVCFFLYVSACFSVYASPFIFTPFNMYIRASFTGLERFHRIWFAAIGSDETGSLPFFRLITVRRRHWNYSPSAASNLLHLTWQPTFDDHADNRSASALIKTCIRRGVYGEARTRDARHHAQSLRILDGRARWTE